MRSSIVLSAVAVLAASVAAQADSADSLSHGSYVASRMRRRASVNLNSGEYMKRNIQLRDATPSSSSSAPVPTYTGFVNLNPSLADTQTSCTSAISGQKADDSGLIPCFNVNFFDNSTGSFQANILLYKVADPSGAWANVNFNSTEKIVTFSGATASVTNSTAMSKRDLAATPVDVEATPIRRIISARSDAPTLMGNYTLIGNVDGSYKTMLTNSTAMREALMPNITLSAVSGGKNLSDALTTPTDAAFVSGWFSQMYLNQQTAIKNAVTPPFVLPGVTLGISKGLFPIGLIVTSVWVILFTAVVGYGTLGRLQWRRAYRAGKPTASGR